MTERAEVEALLAEVNVYTGRKSGLIAELCRTWLTVQDAPVGEVVEAGDDDTGQPRAIIHSTRNELAKGPPLVFQRVRLVRDGGES